MAGVVATHDPFDREHLRWVQTRLMLDGELMEAVRHGFSLIAVGFGSFAFLEGIVGSVGEAASFTTPSRAFSLAATAVGMIVVLVAIRHNRRMTAWVNADEFPLEDAPELPEEQLPL